MEGAIHASFERPHTPATITPAGARADLTAFAELDDRALGQGAFSVAPGDTDTPMNPGAGRNKRSPEQVVDTAWKTMSGTNPSVVDGR